MVKTLRIEWFRGLRHGKRRWKQLENCANEGKSPVCHLQSSLYGYKAARYVRGLVQNDCAQVSGMFRDKGHWISTTGTSVRPFLVIDLPRRLCLQEDALS